MSPEDKPKLASELFKRACIILDNEQVAYDKKVVAEVVKRHFPDNRRVLNELQRYAGTGKIDAGILVNFADLNIKDLMKSMKAKEFTKVRKWVAQNVDGDTSRVFRTIYDTASEYVAPNSVPQVVVTLADYQYKAAFAADAEINMMAMLTEMMIDCEWK
jgi:ribosomal protein S13